MEKKTKKALRGKKRKEVFKRRADGKLNRGRLGVKKEP